MTIACRFLLILLLAAAFASHAHTQPAFHVEKFSTENGLSHQVVTCILKDQEGFMWFGSWDGINRFDGRSFVSFKSSPGDHSVLGNDRIDQVTEDQTGHLWILAYDRQVYRFNKRNRQFVPVQSLLPGHKRINFDKILAAANGMVWLQSSNEGLFCISQDTTATPACIQFKQGADKTTSLPSNAIHFFYVDSAQNIWVGARGGFCRLGRQPGSGYQNVPAGAGFPPDAKITAVAEDGTCLYFGTAGGQIITWNKKTATATIRTVVSGRINRLVRSQLQHCLYATVTGGAVAVIPLVGGPVSILQYPRREPLYDLYEDHTGLLWIEPGMAGVIRCDPVAKSFKRLLPPQHNMTNFTGNRYRVLEDNAGNMWVNMKGGGFGYYDRRHDRIVTAVKTTDATSYALPLFVLNIFYDKNGVLWLTTNERELVKIVPQQDVFKQEYLVSNDVSRWKNEVRGLCYDHRNRLWVGSKSNGLHVYDGSKKFVKLFTNEPAAGLGQIYCILEDRRHTIWLGTKGNGLFRAVPVNADATRYELTQFSTQKNTGNWLGSNEIYALLQDTKGSIWAGSFDHGLFCLADTGKQQRFIQNGNAFINYPKDGFRKIRHMALDAAGNIWAGTTNGLLLLEAAKNNGKPIRCKVFSKIPGDITSLGNNDVQFIYKDAQNIMWLATSGGGLCRAIGQNPFENLHFKSYTTRDGMPNDYVLSCSADKQGNLWIATENGLANFNAAHSTFRNYDSYDGLPRVSFSEASVCRRPSDGQIVFGSMQGFIWFNPANTGKNKVHANIAFTGLQVNNTDIGPGADDSFLKADINYAAALTLEHYQRIISIDYAILDHRGGRQPVFAYRLLGLDSNWYTDRLAGRATYRNLPPGDYVFEVKSANADRYTGEPIRHLAITILPPPWKTWWAYTIYIVLFLVVLYFIRRYALTVIRLRNKIVVEQQLAELKLHFFTNISHELRTPLTLIIGPLDQLAEKAQLSPEAVDYVALARKNAGRMLRFVNQLLDLRKVQSGQGSLRVSRVEILGFLQQVTGFFAGAVAGKHVSLVVETALPEIFAWLDAEKMEVVFYNLLGNAIKFTPPGKTVSVHAAIMAENGTILIRVSDQGQGVPANQLEDIFELFHTGSTSKGTGIGLAFSREIVHLHGGKIWAENNAGGGLTVMVQLLAGHAHFKPENITAESFQTDTTYTEPETNFDVQPAAQTGDGLPLVLLVEDNDELRAFISGQLAPFYHVETAVDGAEGLLKATSLVPDLVISDIMMPNMNGIEMLDKIKQENTTSHIPVVLLSARQSIESKLEGLHYGADCYITKPFNTALLIASVNNLLLQRRQLFQKMAGQIPQAVRHADTTQPQITAKDQAFLSDVIAVVEAKMTDVKFNIESVAERMAMSRTTFYKKFKSLTGVTPVEFVRDLRLERARKLLEAGSVNISEAAYQTGFSSPNYFSTCFKEKYQVSPSEFVRSLYAGK